jgi:hypothetical protein
MLLTNTLPHSAAAAAAVAAAAVAAAGVIPADDATSLSAQEAAISGAALAFTSLLFQGQASSWPKVQPHLAATQATADADQSSQPIAFQQVRVRVVAV